MAIKSIKSVEAREKQKLQIPRSVQMIIPVRRAWKDGIFQLTDKENGSNTFSQMFKFDDVNFSLADDDGKQEMLLAYGSIINAFEPGNRYKITLIKRKVDKERIRNELMIRLKNDVNDDIRKEYNSIIMDKATAANGVMLEFYLTITTFAKDHEEAKAHFANQRNIINTSMKKLDTSLKVIDAAERFKLLRDFYRDDVDEDIDFDFDKMRKSTLSFKDYIAPEQYSTDNHNPNHFKLGENYGRALAIKTGGYGNYIKADFVSKLCSLNKTMALSIDLLAIPTDEAVKAAQDAKMRVESNKMKFFNKAAARKQYGATLPYDQQQAIADVDEWLEDLIENDKRMFMSTVSLVHLAPTLSELDADTKALFATARTNMCQLTKLNWQQLDGLNSTLPYGVNTLSCKRTLTTDGVCAFNPFRAQEVSHAGGIYFGTNKITGNIISVNTDLLTNPNCFITGIPGSGKSMATKFLLLFLGLSTDYEIIVLDPENEFTQIVKLLGGDVVDLSVGKGNYINALDVVIDSEDGGLQSAIAAKTQFMLSIMEQMDRTHPLSAEDNSIINRSLINVYANYDEPTMLEFMNELKQQPEARAKNLAVRIEMFVTGSLNTFAQKSTVKVNNRITSYNLNGLGAMEKKVGMVTVADALVNKVTSNFRQGKKTYVIADEFQVMLEDEYTTQFFCSAWKRWRKRGGIPIGITQNIRYLLDRPETRDMLGNSPFVLMFQMAATDIPRLAEMYNLSDEEINYISSTTEPGDGLMKVGAEFIPFENQIAKDTKIYQMLTTRVTEGFNA